LPLEVLITRAMDVVLHLVDDVGALAAGEFGEDGDFDVGIFEGAVHEHGALRRGRTERFM